MLQPRGIRLGGPSLRSSLRPSTTRAAIDAHKFLCPNRPQSFRPLSILTTLRPFLPSLTTPPSFSSPRASAPSLMPKVSAHPALAATQVRYGQRDTFNPSHRVRKRRHGFLARLKSRGGRKILKRRRLKGRSTLSH